jgi:hypothetical protein
MRAKPEILGNFGKSKTHREAMGFGLRWTCMY